jgi:hypothetical protein
MATQSDLYIDQGTLQEAIITVDDEDYGIPVLNLSGYTPSAKMSRHFSSKTKYDIYVEIHGSPVNGQLRLVFYPDSTANIQYGNYMYEVKIISTTDPTNIKRVLEGVVYIRPKI